MTAFSRARALAPLLVVSSLLACSGAPDALSADDAADDSADLAPLPEAASRGALGATRLVAQGQALSTSLGYAVVDDLAARSTARYVSPNTMLSRRTYELWKQTNGIQRMHYEALAYAFEPGALLFGPTPEVWDAQNAIRFIDGINETFRGGVRSAVVTQIRLIFGVWDDDKPDTYFSDEQIAATLEPTEAGIAFRDFVAGHPRYDIAAQVRRDGAFDAPAAARRMSKAGLEFQLERGAAIHFVVDLMRKSVRSVGTKEPGINLGESITSSELRWLYRHRDDPRVKALVHFWDKHGPVGHRAVFGDPAWRAYEPTHLYDAKSVAAAVDMP